MLGKMQDSKIKQSLMKKVKDIVVDEEMIRDKLLFCYYSFYDSLIRVTTHSHESLLLYIFICLYF